MKFCEKLQKLRKENHLSQESLADKLEVSRQAVSKWESGTTYPEMDKLLTICKLFNVTLDELTNDDISLNDIKKEENMNITKELYYLIDKTFYMFKNMNTKSIFKILFELFILFLILLLFKIPFNYIYSLGTNVIYTIPKGAAMINSIWSFFINLVYFILFILVYIYIYKTYYLDKFEVTETKEKNISEKEEKVNIEETLTETKTIKEKTNFGIGSKVFTVLGKIFTFLIKAFTALISLPFIVSFLLLVVALSILVIYLFKGVTFIGLIIILIGSIIINVLLLLLFLSFIFSTHLNFKRLTRVFIASLGLTAVGIGIFGYEIANTEFINTEPVTEFKKTTDTYELNDNIILDNLDYYYTYDIKYVKDETLKDKVIIETTYYSDLMNFKINSNKIGDYDNIYVEREIKNTKNIIDLAVNDLKNKRVYNYEKLFNVEITVKSSSSTLEKIKNYDKYINGYNCDNIDERYTYELDKKDEKIRVLEEKNNDLTEEINTLKDKIKNILN